MHNILTITCDRDKDQFKIHCASVGRFLEPVCFHVLYTEIDPSWDKFFEEECLPHLGRHQVRVWHAYELSWVSLSNNKYNRDMMCKLLFGLDFQEPYVTLDSKNCFIRPCTVSQLHKTPRKPPHDPVWAEWDYFAYMQQQYGGCDVRVNVTPYWHNPVVTQKIFTEKSPEQWDRELAKFDSISVYVLYDIIAQKYQLDLDPGAEVAYAETLWNSPSLDHARAWWKQQQENPDRLMLSLHWRVWPVVQDDLEYFTQFLL